ncbi:arylesterase [Brevundimonas basaltis]|uniref:Acyl-CoA thioesterase-1 n=2 Tax=Brevundimonas basaltis TaxID=472166 RepID=A0A7W8HY56_9CAUL|nr:acyl-CoA thioesterase-1 [Brevundimonas basaltis]
MRITMLGDSLTAGYGLRAGEALPVRLQTELKRLGHPAAVSNAGVSGDTTSDGLRRIDRDVPDDTCLCIVALGANDMMQLLATDQLRKNLDAIFERLSARAIPAMLCGMRAPPWFGLYAIAFDGVFAEVARRHRIALYPFLLDGIALNPAYALADRLHPNAKGIDVIARRLAPSVAKVLTRYPDCPTELSPSI